MKKIVCSVFIMTATLAAVSLKAQTADEIVSKYIDAIGGKDVIKKINSVYLEGSVQVMGGDNPTTVTILNGKGYKTESEFNGMKAIQCYTDKGGWSVNPMSGGAAEAMPQEIYNAGKDQIDVGGALFDYAAKGSTVTLQGKEGKTYKLKLVTKEKSETTYFIDDATFLLSKVTKKATMMGNEVEVNVSMTDYKKTDIGYSVPYTIGTDLGQFQLTTTIKKVEINKTIDPTIFNMPK
ncbi:MAG: hypothetical protein QM726_13415 [Chitinophagaceae bacterium]